GGGQGIDFIGIFPLIQSARERRQLDCFLAIAKICFGASGAKPGDVVKHIGVASIQSHRGNEVGLCAFEVPEMKVSVAAFTSASRQTKIIFLQTNCARHHVDGLFVTILQIVNDAGIIVTEIKLRLKSNDVEKVAESFVAPTKMLVSQAAKAMSQCQVHSVALVFNRQG